MPTWQEAYPAVHSALAVEYRGLPRERAEQVVRSVLGEGYSLDEAESFFNDLGRTLSQAGNAAAPVLQRALPGAVSGAATGAALGPWGMLGGALLGGLGSALGGGGAAPPGPPVPPPMPAQPMPAPPSMAPPAAVPPPPAPGVPPLLPAMPAPPVGAPALGAGAGPTTAVAQLLAALGSPTVQQALSSMLLGPAGARSVPDAGGNQVPVAAITNLVGMLASRASAEWEAAVPSVEGESLGEGLETAAPEVRAASLLGRLAAPEAAGEGEDESVDEAWIDELYDELEAELVYADSFRWTN